MHPDRALELKVGIFVAIGLAMIGGFVLKFGRLGEGFKVYYDLTVRFKDASGLLKGSDVVLSGEKIGRVARHSSKHQWHFHSVEYRGALARVDARFASEHREIERDHQ